MDNFLANSLFEKTKEILAANGKDALVYALLFTEKPLTPLDRETLRNRYFPQSTEELFSNEPAQKDAYFESLRVWIMPKRKQAESSGNLGQFIVRFTPQGDGDNLAFRDPTVEREIRGEFLPFILGETKVSPTSSVSPSTSSGSTLAPLPLAVLAREPTRPELVLQKPQAFKPISEVVKQEQLNEIRAELERDGFYVGDMSVDATLAGNAARAIVTGPDGKEMEVEVNLDAAAPRVFTFIDRKNPQQRFTVDSFELRKTAVNNVPIGKPAIVLPGETAFVGQFPVQGPAGGGIASAISKRPIMKRKKPRFGALPQFTHPNIPAKHEGVPSMHGATRPQHPTPAPRRSEVETPAPQEGGVRKRARKKAKAAPFSGAKMVGIGSAIGVGIFGAGFFFT